MKKNMTKVMAMGMVLTMLAGTTAFASGTAAEATKGVLATAEDTKQAKAAFLGESGKIVSVEKSGTDETPRRREFTGPTVFPLWKSKTKMAVCALQLMQTA